MCPKTRKMRKLPDLPIKRKKFIRRAKTNSKKVPGQPHEKEGHRLEEGRSSFFGEVFNDDQLRTNFHTYLKGRTAKGKVVNLSVRTMDGYMNHIFGPKLGCFKDWCKEVYGEDFQLFKFMFHAEEEYQTLNRELLEKVATAQEPYGSSHASIMSSAVIWLLRFFSSAASAIHLPRKERDIISEHNEYCKKAGDAESDISKKIAGLREHSELQSAANKERRKILNPGDEERKREACTK